MPSQKSKTPTINQRSSASSTSKSMDKTSPGKKSKSADKPKALKNANIRVKRIKDQSDENRLQAAHRYLKNESWKDQGYKSLEDAIENESLSISSKSLKRLAKSHEQHEKVHGTYVAGCAESVLRPISSLTTDECDQIKEYLSDKDITLANKTVHQAYKLFTEALAPAVIDDEDYIAAKEKLTKITMRLLEDAEFNSKTAQNIVTEVIAMDVRKSLRWALSKQLRRRQLSKPRK